jgi:molybdenum cofactor cytidylyltransferase
MGRNKMLLEVEGERIGRRAVDRALDAGLDPVVVVTGHEAEELKESLIGADCTFAYNPDFTGPTSGSLHKGLHELGSDVDAVVVMLADMVNVSTEMIRALVENAARTPAPLVVSRYGDVLAPPLLFKRPLFPELLAWHGEGCGKAVVKAHQHEAVFVDWPLPGLVDIDTPDDYAEVMRYQ